MGVSENGGTQTSNGLSWIIIIFLLREAQVAGIQVSTIFRQATDCTVRGAKYEGEYEAADAVLTWEHLNKLQSSK